MKANKISFLLSLAITIISINVSAQTLQGYVKTIGRPAQKGTPISGVSIRVQGEHNAVLSNNEGKFSVILIGKKNGDAYSLRQVQKTGYELNEKDVIGRPYAFSDKVPLIIVMVSSAQLQADKQRIEDNAYQEADRSYQAKLALLKKQNESGVLTAKQYRQQLQDLQSKFEQYQSLISDMANYYAHVDYDDLDATEQEINNCIEQGDLERADSLLQHTGIIQQVEDISRRLAAGQQLLEEAYKDQAAILQQQNKDADHLYLLYTIAASRYDFERAAFYLETRAELDTTNTGRQLEAARYYYKQNLYNKAIHFYERAIRWYRYYDKVLNGFKNYSEASMHNFSLPLSCALTELAQVYVSIHRLTEAETLLLEAHSIQKRLSGEYPMAYDSFISETLNEIASLYEETHRQTEADTLYQEALVICRRLAKENPKAFEYYLASTIGNVANLRQRTGRLKEAETLYLECLDIYKRLNEQAPHKYQLEIASTLNNLAVLYTDTRRFSEAETMYREAIDLCKNMAKQNPQEYEPEVAMKLYNFANMLVNDNRPKEAEGVYLESLEIYRRLAKQNPQVFESDVASSLTNLANLYYRSHRLTEAESVYKEALDYFRPLAQSNLKEYGPNTAVTLNNLAYLYYSTERLLESGPVYREALRIYSQLAESYPQTYEQKMVGILNRLMILYDETKQKSEEETMYEEVLITYKRLAEESPSIYEPKVARTLVNLASLYNIWREEEAISAYEEALAIYRRLVEQSPQRFEPDMASALFCLGLLYPENQQKEESYREALRVYRRLSERNPQTYEPKMKKTLEQLIYLYERTKQYSEEILIYKEVLSTYMRLVEQDSQKYKPEVAYTLYCIGEIYVKKEQYEDAIVRFTEALDIYRMLAEKNSDYLYNCIDCLDFLSVLYSHIGNYTSAYQMNEEGLLLMKQLYSDNPYYYDEYASKLGNQSFYAIFMKKYSESEHLAREGMSIDSTQHWIASNLAAALLFQGRYEEACAIYSKYKAELKDSFLDDFRQYAQAGVIPNERKADVKRVKKMLNK